MTDFTFKVEKADTVNKLLRVVYTRSGYPDIRKNLRAFEFTTDSVRELINREAPLEIWDRIDNPPELDPAVANGLTGSMTHTPRPEKPFNPTPEEQLAFDIMRIEQDRYNKEHGGVLWVDSEGKQWGFDTAFQSQSRLTGAQAAMNKGGRQDGGVWKCQSFDGLGGSSIAYRPMTNLELSEIADLVHSHVQKCFEAEGLAVVKRLAGDESASFETEWVGLSI